MAERSSSTGLIIAAPHSGSGKTLVTLGLIAALRARGVRVVAAKTGPDYIDTDFLSRAAGHRATNLDPWAMETDRLRAIANRQGADGDLLLIEGVMGLFDGAANGKGSTADLAESLALPVVLVVDAARQSQSVAALVSGFDHWREGVNISGVILNNVGSVRHENLLRTALAETRISVLACLPRLPELRVPGRHLGLVLPAEIGDFETLLHTAAETLANHCDLKQLLDLAQPLPLPDVATKKPAPILPPLAQHVAIARDRAFVFLYRHWLDDWRNRGAEISFFSPLANEAPDETADAIFLPGGYPELHGEQLAGAEKFRASMHSAANVGKLIYAECGGYMVLGECLTDKHNVCHQMCGLLPHETAMNAPRRVLGYRRLTHNSPLPWAPELSGHEFHYSTSSTHQLPPLFQARDASGNSLPAMGALHGRIMGSYAHIIDQGHPAL